MRARWWWSLLLLAAVFAMHGPSCVAADSAMADMPLHFPAVSSDPGPGGAFTAGVVLTAAGARTAPAVDADTVGAAVQHTGSSGQGGPAVHALMVCLAVLAGGLGAALATLAAWMARRRRPPAVSSPSRRVRVALDRVTACAPTPELSRLCVLRV